MYMYMYMNTYILKSRCWNEPMWWVCWAADFAGFFWQWEHPIVQPAVAQKEKKKKKKAGREGHIEREREKLYEESIGGGI